MADLTSSPPFKRVRIFDGRGSLHLTPDSRRFPSAPNSEKSIISPGINFSQTSAVGDCHVDASVSETFFNDPIYQNIHMEEVCLRIIDTKEYQRLDKLKQLGTTNFVFRGASHTRFGHSLGVAHLAEKVVTTLRKNQPSLQITDADVLCVKIAGLCHDLGHGPFSHVFDGVFIKRMYPKGVNKFDISTWRHEDGSVRMFNHILTKNSIDLSDYGLSKVDKLFIEEIIGGVEEDGRKGRRFEKFYLYDIVNNIRSGLDVDKLDYFQRDIRYTNISKNNCTYDRVIEFGRVLPAEPLDVDKKRNKDNELAANSRQTDISTYPRMICYPQKQVREVFEIFQHRFMLHQSVYTHKSVKKIEFMLVDILELADPYIRILGAITSNFPTGQYKISECIFDMEAMANLNDTILDIIMNDPREELKPAKDLLDNLYSRKMYTCLGKTPFNRHDAIFSMSTDEIAKQILSFSDKSIEKINKRDSSNRMVVSNIAANLADEDGHDFIQSGDTRLINYEDSYDAIIHSQDSVLNDHHFNNRHAHEVIEEGYSNMSSDSNGDPQNRRRFPLLPLEMKDLIVERMHIHYGQKELNPVNNVRFYSKHDTNNGSGLIGKAIPEANYATLLPKVFEDFQVRVFCRSIEKTEVAFEAFSLWCSHVGNNTPFLSQSYPPVPATPTVKSPYWSQQSPQY